MRYARWIIVGLLLFAGLAGAQTTKPATSPVELAEAEVREAERIIASDQQVLDDKIADLNRSFETTVEYKALATAVLAADEKLQAARKTGTPQQKLDASSAYNKARAALDIARKTAVDGDADVKELRSKVAKAEYNLSIAKVELQKAYTTDVELRKAEAEAKIEADPILRAIRDGKLAIGMTLAQANHAMKKDGRLVEETQTTKVYEWPHSYVSGGRIVGNIWVNEYSTMFYWAHIESGKIVHHGKR